MIERDDQNGGSLIDSEPSLVDQQAICDVCEWPIFGIRYKCSYCRDFDLCAHCEARRTSDTDGALHDRHHRFLKVRIPLPAPQNRPSLKLPLVGTTDDFPHRSIICDTCDRPVFGIRYKCTHCRNVDFCAACEAMWPDLMANGVKHPSTHLLLKIVDPIPSSISHLLNLPPVYPTSGLRNSGTRLARAMRPVGVATPEKHPAKSLDSAVHVYLRDMSFEDITPHILAIEEESFADPYPYHCFVSYVNPRNDCVFARVAINEGAEADRSIGGYILFFTKRDTLVIASLAVALHSRRRGIATMLMEDALSVGRASPSIKRAKLHVNVFNTGAQKLYTSLGFSTTAWLKNYYEKEQDDGLVMHLQLM